MAKKTKVQKSEGAMMCMPQAGVKDWMHVFLAIVIILFLLLNQSGYWWAYWIAFIAAALILLSGLMKCCRK